MTSVLDRIFARCERRGGCLIWTGATNNGYGQIGVGSRLDGTRRTKHVHRVVYEELVGEIAPGMTVDHLCEVHACCEPSHLEQVTRSENSRRGWRRHAARGRPMNAQKLTPEIVLAIREAVGTQAEIATRFGITNQHVSDIINRKRWTTV